MSNFSWEIKLDLELADRVSEAWDMDHSLGWQGSSVPEDRTEAGVRCYPGRWGDLTCLPPCLDRDWGSKSKNDLGTVRVGGGEGQTAGEEEPSVLTPCLGPLWAASCRQAARTGRENDAGFLVTFGRLDGWGSPSGPSFVL